MTIHNNSADLSTAGKDDLIVAENVDSPVKLLHLFILLFMGTGLFFDTIETSMTNVLATVFSQDTAVSKSALSLLLASMFVGGAIGPPVTGRIADRIGRRRTLLIVLAGYGIASVIAGLMPDITSLAIARFFGGLLIASYPPLMWTYLSEVMPPKVRGQMMALTGVLGGFGSIAAPVLARYMDIHRLFGLEGWQWPMILGGLGSILVALGTIPLPESPRWLAKMGRQHSAEVALKRFSASPVVFARFIGRIRLTPQVAELAKRDAVKLESDIRGAGFVSRLCLLIALQLSQPVAVIGFIVLSGIIIGQKGFPVHDSLLFTGIIAAGAPLGGICAALFIDRISRPKLILGASIAMAVLGLGFALAQGAIAVVSFGTAYLLIGVIYSLAINLYGTEMFATEHRGSTSGIGYSANRLGSALVPLAMLPLLYWTGPVTLFLLITVILMIASTLVMIIGPRDTAGRALD